MQRERVYGIVALACALLYFLSVRHTTQPRSARASSAHGNSDECSAAYEACGAMPAPVGLMPCCDPNFFCFTVPPYFSQCRPKCAPLGAGCGMDIPCCAGTRCGKNDICVARASAWYAGAIWRGRWSGAHASINKLGKGPSRRTDELDEKPRYLSPEEVYPSANRITANQIVSQFQSLLNGTKVPEMIVAFIPDSFTASERLRLRRRVVKALRDPGMSVDATHDKLQVFKKGWTMGQAQEVGLVLASFPEVREVIPR